MYHNSNERYQFDKDKRKYCRYDEETDKSIKTKTEEQADSLNACLFFRYLMVCK